MRLEPLFTLAAILHPHEIGATPEGSRVDVEFAGDLEASGRVTGHLRGVDYITIDGNSRGHLHIHGTVTSPSNEVVAFRGTGLALFAADGTVTTQEFFTFQTAASSWEWLNSIAGFGVGQGDLNTREFRLAVYTLAT